MFNEEPKSELYFSWWINELREIGFIHDCVHQPEQISLSPTVYCEWETTKIKKKQFQIVRVNKRLISEHKYTPDYKIMFTVDAINVLISNVEYIDPDGSILLSCDPKNKLITFDRVALVECKPIFDQNNMTREFKINQKWIYDQGKFINLVKIPDFFERTFTPRLYIEDQIYKKRTQDKKNKVWHEIGESKLRYTPRTLDTYLINPVKFKEVGGMLNLWGDNSKNVTI